jgi:nucleoside-diphosphate-sugar epimerase
MRVLVTGAGGFLGGGLIAPFEGRHDLRLMDVCDWQAPHEKFIGSVTDLETCRRAAQGCQGLVIAHMASNQAGSYETPGIPFDVNVKGTANLFFAAAEAGIRHAVLISSAASIGGNLGRHRKARATLDLPLKPSEYMPIYSVTKACQEIIAEFYHRHHGMNVAVLRLGNILSADDPNCVVDKYGVVYRVRHIGSSERRDVGLAARLALEASDLGYQVFYVISTPEADQRYEMEPLRRLGWKAERDLSWLPPAEEGG